LPKNLPIALLIASNLIPVIGVIYAGWSAASIVLVYWAENLVIGFYNILKMLTVASSKDDRLLPRLFAVGFFVIHFGGFAAGHGSFLLDIFDINTVPAPTEEQEWPGPLMLLQLLFTVMHTLFSEMPKGFMWAIAALLISHGASFLLHFLMGGERHRTTVNKLMMQPYSRVLIMHVAIIICGFFVIKLGSPLSMLVALVLVKTAMDIVLHRREHRRLQT
jgi:hypothetical protein